MEKNQQSAVAQMRGLVQELGYTTKREGDETLLRFLVARSMNPRDAAKMFVEWLKWRDAFVPLGHIPENEIPDQLQARKIMLNGPNGDGCPILIVQACKHFPHKDRLQLKKFVVHVLDKAIASGFKEREVGNEKLIGVIDLQKISYKNIDARALITGFQYLQAYYPERLSKCYMLNMPWIFVSVWNMISRFLDQATLDKVVIVKNEEEMKGYAQEIGEEWLPEEYRGRAKLLPIQDVKLNHWPLP